MKNFLLTPLFAAAVCVPACVQRRPAVEIFQEKVCTVRLHLDSDCSGAADVFAFESGGIGRAVRHLRTDSCNLAMTLAPGGYVLAAVCGAPGEFSSTLTLEMLESVRFNYLDCSDGPEVSSGEMPLNVTGDTSVVIPMDRLAAMIVLRSVANALPGYTLVESPRVRLTGIPASAEPFRWSGFRANAYIDLPWKPAGGDIGQADVYPGIELLCFPDEDAIGTGGARFEMSYRVRGVECLQTVSIGEIRRGETRYLDISIR